MSRTSFDTYVVLLARAIVASGLLLLPASVALADCTDPDGIEGMMVYNTTHKTAQFCDGTTWWAMKGGGALPPCPDNDTLLSLGGSWVCSSDDPVLLTKLLIHGDGSDGSTAFADSSPSVHSVTASGNAQVDTAQSRFGGASVLFDGTGDRLTVPDSADWDFGTEPFTIDFWMRQVSPADSDTMLMFGRDNGPGSLRVAAGGPTSIWVEGDFDSCGNDDIPVANDTWQHIALVRDDDTLRIFVNGVQQDTCGISGDFSGQTDGWTFGQRRDGASTFSNDWPGWLDEIRVSKGVARWTSNFTPPTAPY